MRSGGGGGGKFVRGLTLFEAIAACGKEVGEKTNEDLGEVEVGDDMCLITKPKTVLSCIVMRPP